eukprot:11227666-Lingulodinium_polyedra.AAC.1
MSRGRCQKQVPRCIEAGRLAPGSILAAAIQSPGFSQSDSQTQALRLRLKLATLDLDLDSTSQLGLRLRLNVAESLSLAKRTA